MTRMTMGSRVPTRARPGGRRWWEKTREEIYAYRTDKPHAPLGLPLIGRHWGYAGRTNNPKRRDMEHTKGGGPYAAVVKPWSDLRPRRHVIFKMRKRTEIVTHLLEWLAIKILLPVYNHDMNLTNPRRVTLAAAARQRAMRDQLGTTARAIKLSLRLGIYALLIVIAVAVAGRLS